VAVFAALSVALGLWQQWIGGSAGADAGVPQQLPPVPDGFEGRAADRSAVLASVRGGARVVVVVGSPGMGKTAFALWLAHTHRKRYRDGQLFAALRDASADPQPPAAVLDAFLAALRVPDEQRRGDTDVLAARLRSVLAGRRVLIVLDDARDASQLNPLLAGGPRCLTIVTSRRLLTELPGAAVHPMGALDDGDAGSVLAADAGAARVSSDRAGAARLVRLCAGLPLALRIAAARLRARPSWTPGDLADRLEDEQRRLTEFSQGEAAVRAAFDGSYRELPEPDRTVFRRIGGHPAHTMDLPAAAALADLPADAASPVLERLVDAHLVESPAIDRYRLHDLMRLYAVERLAAEEPPGAATAGLARLVAGMTARYAVSPVDTADHAALVPVVRTAVDAGLHEPAWNLVDVLHPRLEYAGHHPLWLLLWEQAARAARALGDDRRLSHALRLVATAHRHAGLVQRALEPAAEAAALARTVNDRREQVQALYSYGETLRDLNRLDEARRTLEDTLALAGELGDVGTELQVRNALATVFTQGWQPELAVPVLERALTMAPPTGSRELAWVLLNLSGVYRATGRREEGAAMAHRAVAMAGSVGDDFALGYALAELMTLASAAGRTDDARGYLHESIGAFRRISHGTGVGIVHQRFGARADEAGRWREAIRHHDTATAQFEELSDPPRTAIARLYRAAAYAGANQRAAAHNDWAAAEREPALPSSPEVDLLRRRLRQRLGAALPVSDR